MRVYIAGRAIPAPLRSWAEESGFEVATADSPAAGEVLVGPTGLEIDIQREKWICQFGFDRIFESCFLSIGLPMEQHAQSVRDLFSIIGPVEYAKSIEPAHNAGCYDELFKIASNFCKRKITSLVDLGCGPGTILESSVPHTGLEILGFDFVKENLRAANMRGLITLDEAEFSTLSRGRFDAILCAYVMHYESMSTEFIRFVSGLLAPGGVWVSNFHKGKGLTSFRSQISTITDLTTDKCSSQFGPVIAVIRSC